MLSKWLLTPSMLLQSWRKKPQNLPADYPQRPSPAWPGPWSVAWASHPPEVLRGPGQAGPLSGQPFLNQGGPQGTEPPDGQGQRGLGDYTTSCWGSPSLQAFGASALSFPVASFCSVESGLGRGPAEVLGRMGAPHCSLSPPPGAPVPSLGGLTQASPGTREEVINHRYLLFLM